VDQGERLARVGELDVRVAHLELLAGLAHRDDVRVVAHDELDLAPVGRRDRSVEARRGEQCGRNATPSGVMIVSGTSTDTHASAPAFSRPAEPIASSLSRISAACSSSQRA
jgi:hypothetical protein